MTKAEKLAITILESYKSLYVKNITLELKILLCGAILITTSLFFDYSITYKIIVYVGGIVAFSGLTIFSIPGLGGLLRYNELKKHFTKGFQYLDDKGEL